MALISYNGPMTRGQLADETSLTAAAISRITRELIGLGLIGEGSGITHPGRAGRRESLLSIDPQGAYVLGVSITANRCSISLADATGAVLTSVECNEIPVRPANKFLDTLCERIKSLVFDADFNRTRLLGIGVSAAISASSQRGSDIRDITSDPLGWRNVPVSRTLSEALQLPVRVEHRASAILRGEVQELSSDEDVLLANVALGIGTSAWYGGRLLNSGNRGFGSLSHFSIPGSAVACSCGRTGCLEMVASGKAVLGALHDIKRFGSGAAIRLSQCIQDANSGDKNAQDAFGKAGSQLALGIDAALSLQNPDKVILAGEVGRQENYYQGMLEALERLGRRNPSRLVSRSAITSETAAISVALHNFLYKMDNDSRRMKVA